MKSKRTISYIPYSFVPNHTPTIEALSRSRLSSREFRLILFIMRQTDGYLREEDPISPSFFHTKTGIDKSNLSHALKRIHKLNIITITPGQPPTYSVNPPDTWNHSVFVSNDEKSRQNEREDSSKMTKRLVKNDEKQIDPKDNLKITLKKTRSREDKYIQGRYGHLVRR